MEILRKWHHFGWAALFHWCQQQKKTTTHLNQVIIGTCKWKHLLLKQSKGGRPTCRDALHNTTEINQPEGMKKSKN